LYADDIVFLASTAEGLQEQLETLNNWSTKWALNVNIDKTKVLHVRKASVARCEYRFKLGDLVVDYTSQYRYLGFTLGETLDYAVGVNELLTAGGRALGALVSKYFKLDGMDYETYTKLFDSTVTPIIDYGSGVWGFKEYDGLNKLENRAIRSYLGTGKFTPIPALTGEMGWILPYVRNHCQMVKLWCQIVSMHKCTRTGYHYAYSFGIVISQELIVIHGLITLNPLCTVVAYKTSLIRKLLMDLAVDLLVK